LKQETFTGTVIRVDTKAEGKHHWKILKLQEQPEAFYAVPEKLWVKIPSNLPAKITLTYVKGDFWNFVRNIEAETETALPEVKPQQIKPSSYQPKTPLNQRVNQAKTLEIPIEKLVFGIYTPRLEYGDLTELANSLQKEGLHYPIIVCERQGKFPIIDGERRAYAAKKLGWKTITAKLLELSEQEAQLLAFKLNDERKTLEPLEEATYIQKLIQTHNWTQQQVGNFLGKSQQWISGRLKLIEDASEKLKQALTTRVVKPRTAIEITELPKEEQPIVLDKVVKEGLSTKETRRLVDAFKQASPQQRRLLLEAPKDRVEFVAEQILKGVEEPKPEPERPSVEEVEEQLRRSMAVYPVKEFEEKWIEADRERRRLEKEEKSRLEKEKPEPEFKPVSMVEPPTSQEIFYTVDSALDWIPRTLIQVEDYNGKTIYNIKCKDRPVKITMELLEGETEA